MLNTTHCLGVARTMRESIALITVSILLISCNPASPPPQPASPAAASQPVPAGATGTPLTLADMQPEAIIGELGKPLGTPIRIEGEIVESPTKFGMSYPNLRVTRIAEGPVAEPLIVLLTPYDLDFGETHL